MLYRFGDCSLDTKSLELRRGGDAVPIEPLVFRVLAYLIANRDRVISKDELIDAIWDGRVISDGTLNSGINAARRAVGDSGSAQAIIKTFPRQGIRFISTVWEDTVPNGHQGIVTGLTDKPSIAVLPFDNVSGDPRQDFIGDGLASDVIAALSRVRSFFVIARNSTFQYKGTSPDVRQVAKELNVRYVVEGNARNVGDRLRISVQLVDGDTGHSLWSERYDREFKDLFEVQDEMTLAIVGQLEPELGRAEYDRVKARKPDELDAWELYHRGMHLLLRLMPEDQVEARRYFDAAIERDPHFAPAHAAICYSYFRQGIYQGFEGLDLEAAVAAGKRSIEFDDRDARGHLALSWAYCGQRNFDAAIHEASLALDLNPSSASAHATLAICLADLTGRAEEALPLLDSAIALSPYDPEIGLYFARKARANLYLKRHDQAVAWAQKAMRHRTNWLIRLILISALGHLNRLDEARLEIDEVVAMRPEAGISFVEANVPTLHRPYMDHLLEGLRKAGLREHGMPLDRTGQAVE